MKNDYMTKKNAADSSAAFYQALEKVILSLTEVMEERRQILPTTDIASHSKLDRITGLLLDISREIDAGE